MNARTTTETPGLFHAALVVPDLGDAMATLTELLGLTWTPPIEWKVRVRTGVTEDRSISARATMSVQGPMHIELIQAVKGTIYDLGSGPHVHHLGLWTADLSAASQHATSCGMAMFAASVGADGAFERFVLHDSNLGVLMEFLDEAHRPILEERLRASAAE